MQIDIVNFDEDYRSNQSILSSGTEHLGLVGVHAVRSLQMKLDVKVRLEVNIDIPVKPRRDEP